MAYSASSIHKENIRQIYGAGQRMRASQNQSNLQKENSCTIAGEFLSFSLSQRLQSTHLYIFRLQKICCVLFAFSLNFAPTNKKQRVVLCNQSQPPPIKQYFFDNFHCMYLYIPCLCHFQIHRASRVRQLRTYPLREIC